MEPDILDYIRAQRRRYTREAITQRLLAVGHSREDVDAAWAQVELEGPPEPLGDGARERQARRDRVARAIAFLLAGAGLAILVGGWLAYGGNGIVGLSFALSLLGISPLVWFGRERPMGVVALGAFLLLLPQIAVLSLLGAAFANGPGPLAWVAAFVVGGSLVVRWAFGWDAPDSVIGWFAGSAGAVVLVLLVAGGTCLVSLPFLNA